MKSSSLAQVRSPPPCGEGLGVGSCRALPGESLHRPSAVSSIHRCSRNEARDNPVIEAKPFDVRHTLAAALHAGFHRSQSPAFQRTRQNQRYNFRLAPACESAFRAASSFATAATSCAQRQSGCGATTALASGFELRCCYEAYPKFRIPRLTPPRLASLPPSPQGGGGDRAVESPRPQRLFQLFRKIL